jgi:hypothetical protein
MFQGGRGGNCAIRRILPVLSRALPGLPDEFEGEGTLSRAQPDVVSGSKSRCRNQVGDGDAALRGAFQVDPDHLLLLRAGSPDLVQFFFCGLNALFEFPYHLLPIEDHAIDRLFPVAEQRKRSLDFGGGQSRMLRDLLLLLLSPDGVDRKDPSLQEILFPLERLDRRFRPPLFPCEVLDALLQLLYALVDRLGPEKILDGHPRDTRIALFDLRG